MIPDSLSVRGRCLLEVLHAADARDTLSSTRSALRSLWMPIAAAAAARGSSGGSPHPHPYPHQTLRKPRWLWGPRTNAAAPAHLGSGKLLLEDRDQCRHRTGQLGQAQQDRDRAVRAVRAVREHSARTLRCRRREPLAGFPRQRRRSGMVQNVLPLSTKDKPGWRSRVRVQRRAHCCHRRQLLEDVRSCRQYVPCRVGWGGYAAAMQRRWPPRVNRRGD
jgi:hypothetical protein